MTAQNSLVKKRPTVALAMGDPAGISPELSARLLAQTPIRSATRLVVFGDLRILAEGAKTAGISLPALDLTVCFDTDALGDGVGPYFVDLQHLAPQDFKRGEASPAGGAFALENFRRALLMAQAKKADAVCFTPFNKKAMRYAYPGYDDDVRFISDVLNFHGKAREFNVLGNLWNARVTSHIPLRHVAASLSIERIVSELMLTAHCLREAGLPHPRIAVAGLNPHAGDGGNFGSEEIDIIAPAVAKGLAQGVNVSGPYPADTVFVRAQKGEFDAVLTMFHDQGQIAMKLIGFDRGVTFFGGFPFPICTPAHGTAYDIVDKGIANIGASQAALLLAIRMATKAHA